MQNKSTINFFLYLSFTFTLIKQNKIHHMCFFSLLLSFLSSKFQTYQSQSSIYTRKTKLSAHPSWMNGQTQKSIISFSRPLNIFILWWRRWGRRRVSCMIRWGNKLCCSRNSPTCSYYDNETVTKHCTSTKG